MTKKTGSLRTPIGRARLLETARRLFMRHGAANVGINDVTDAAGVARMTLYNNFPSKKALTVAVYEDMAVATLRALEGLERPTSEDARVQAIFDFFGAGAANPDHRGCPFIHASLQEAEPSGPVHAVVRSYKRKLREFVWRALDDDRENRAELADQLVLLLDGAVTEAHIEGVDNPVASAKRAAAALLRST